MPFQGTCLNFLLPILEWQLRDPIDASRQFSNFLEIHKVHSENINVWKMSMETIPSQQTKTVPYM